MATPLIETAEALKVAVAAALGVTVTRRYVPYYDAESVATGKYFVLQSSEEVVDNRHCDEPRLTLAIAFQIALPAATDANPNPLENNTWLDAQGDKVEAIRDLFRENGSLRRTDVGNASFRGFGPFTPYLPDMLLDNQIYTALVPIEFDYQSTDVMS